jgi:hypothetical protein
MVQKTHLAEILSSPLRGLDLFKSMKTMQIYSWEVWPVYPVQTAILKVGQIETVLGIDRRKGTSARATQIPHHMQNESY